MQTGRASKTALGVAIRRAAHQLMDHPPVLDDPIAVPLVGSGHPRHMERAMHPVGRDFRAFMAVRSRYVEDQLANAVAHGVTQYVVLGAGLDTFAYRNPFPSLHVFEVDFPATQQWKQSMLDEAGIALPANLTFVPMDFEHHTLAEELARAGFNLQAPAFFGWLGVVPYLTLAAFRATLGMIAQLPQGSAVGFDYALSPQTLSPLGRVAFDALAARVAAAGEPFKLFSTPESMESELRTAGFHSIEQLDYDQLKPALLQQSRRRPQALPSEAGYARNRLGVKLVESLFRSPHTTNNRNRDRRNLFRCRTS
jgi:methyltransferase (TIGR00027 family)